MIKIAHIHVWDQLNKGDVGIVLAVQDILRNAFGNVEIVDLPVETLKKANKDIIELINSQDILVIGGGGIFYRYFLPFDKKVIDSIKIPIIIFGVGYIREVGSRKLYPEEKESIVYLCRKASLIGVRDYYTKNFLTANGLKKETVDVIGDPAVFLREDEPENFKMGEALKIGLNLNYSGWLGFGRWQEEIIFSYRRTAEWFIENYNAEIYYLLHHPGEKNILHELRIPKMKIVDLPICEQKYVYRRLDLIIGMMLHSCVIAFGAETPAVNIAYDIRNKSFAKFINSPELVVSLNKLKDDALLERALSVFKNRDFYIKKFQNRKKKIEKKYQKFIEKKKELINQL